jgi:hypothetical protein
MKKNKWKLVKFMNMFIGLTIGLWLVSVGLGMFAIVFAILITFLNMNIDEILNGTD